MPRRSECAQHFGDAIDERLFQGLLEPSKEQSICQRLFINVCNFLPGASSIVGTMPAPCRYTDHPDLPRPDPARGFFRLLD